MAENVYGFTDSKSRVQVVDKATQDAKNSALDAKDTAQDGRITSLETTVGKISAGDGITYTEGVIAHSNKVTAQTSYIGSATNVPRIKFDAQGHITGVDTDMIYAPTSPGEDGQVWTSDGVGTGAWVTPDSFPTEDSTKPVQSGGVHHMLGEKMNRVLTGHMDWLDCVYKTWMHNDSGKTQIIGAIFENDGMVVVSTTNTATIGRDLADNQDVLCVIPVHIDSGTLYSEVTFYVPKDCYYYFYDGYYSDYKEKYIKIEV